MFIECIKEFNPGKGATLGKIYKIINGKIIYDNGTSSLRNYKDLEQINIHNTAKFKRDDKRAEWKMNAIALGSR